jgi:type I restriction enzyme S subunit
MSSEWPIEKLGDLTINLDTKRKPVKEADRKPGPYPYYGASGIVDYVDGYIFDGEHLLIAEDGENLRTRQTPIAFRACGKFWVNNHAHIVVGNERASTRYLEYAVLASDITSYLTGAVMPKLTQGNMNRIEVPCPPRDVQDQIVGVLGSLDDRITLLRETNTTLEAIAQALFKSWFVDFDPVHAKMQGRTPEGMDEATAALFPDSFEESELGDVPKGWRSGDLNTLAELNPESWSAKHHPGRVLYVDLANTKAGQIDDYIDFSFEEAPSRARRVLRCGDVIVGTVRPGNRSFARIASDLTGLTGSTGFAVLRSREVVDQALVYIAATNDEAIDRLSHLADGGAYPAVRPEVVGNTPLVIAPEEIRNSFGEIANPLFASIGANQDRMKQLASLRDTLLPRLISGKLQLPEVGQLEESLA